ncbi:SepM family pheromone-processing serine protease [Anaerobacillus isosaccharinicus]|uniref:endopeptidase La n=1 Tax=Anaerobacillus isosaccharinicus TaxID=1532552 RepID=A0A1S2M7J0_9BACI|nr:SepM family pheromone-processing serine protease [Anaerobacillus isosaccharinicus]MBA5587457.1 PDZ domain-containing protein [Anaerobacillus isosaccharinicus]QOY34358.1 PDZ domain-containing protein [Anaerobacillus isosaccharinicus]
MANTQRFPSLKKRWIFLIIFVLIINFYQLPYYFTKPGDAKVLHTVIEVEGGFEDKGTFMLTTVRMGPANIINYVWAKMSDARELIHKDFVRRSGETDEEYHHRQLMMMSTSQDLATIVAYNKAGKEAYYTNLGVIVTGTIEQMPAFDLLELGDLIVAVDQREITTVDELLAQIGDKQKDAEVSITIVREGVKKDVELHVTSFPEDLDPSGERVGIGITSPVTKRELSVNPDIFIDTNKIGGPSAGLMFSLEIYNQLIQEDITKGYQIAGTGTINEDGEVGRIGGIKQKVIAAERAGADYFFAPNEFDSPTSNYIDAVEAAESINARMKIIPIDTFDQAIEFLGSLDPK